MITTARLHPFALCLLLNVCCSAHADMFGVGTNAFEIDFVTIGSPGNVPDTTASPNPLGAVDYTYRIGQFEFDAGAVRKASAQSAHDGNPLTINVKEEVGDNQPFTTSWIQAARIVNWLNTSTGSVPAYKFDDSRRFQLHEVGDDGFNPDNPFRNSQARYFLPSADEWHKAAYYDPATEKYFDYPTASDTVPAAVAGGTITGTAVFDQPLPQGPAEVKNAGGSSPFGTVGQAGNVWEWEETTLDLLNSDTSARRGLRGGQYLSSPSAFFSSERDSLSPLRSGQGFRVASVFSTSGTNELLGDIDGDGVVGFTDFLALANSFSTEVEACTNGDFNCDGTVAFDDFLQFAENFGRTSQSSSQLPSATVPEPNPNAFCLLVFAYLASMSRRWASSCRYA